MKRKPDQQPSTTLLYVQIILFGFTVSTMSFASLAAIPFMPIGDLIVICFVSPVFSVFLDWIVLKRSLNLLSVSLCFLIILGNLMVVQPPIIFPGKDSEKEVMENSEVITDISQKKHGQYYYVGVVLYLYSSSRGSI